MSNDEETTTTNIRCHYDVLGVSQDADVKTIKKAHRKLALKYHPDKSTGMEHEFLLVQQAYECLSDVQERAWYDDHREAILNGWTGQGSNDDVNTDDMIFNVVPYQHPSCYEGFSDAHSKSFFNVYQHVFTQIIHNEMSHGKNWDLDFPSQFGNSTTEWNVISQFYACWESYGTSINFAWVDQYDVMDAPNRRVRRAMEDENKKLRKVARKARNEDVVALVHFVKRRDPRVKEYQQEQEQLRIQKEKAAQELKQQQKIQKQKQREEWKVQQEYEMQQQEKQDELAGRVRLADLDDDDYEYSGGGKKKRGKKKNKKKNKKRQEQEEEEAAKAEAEADKANEEEHQKEENKGNDNDDDDDNEVDTGDGPTETGEDEGCDGMAINEDGDDNTEQSPQEHHYDDDDAEIDMDNVAEIQVDDGLLEEDEYYSDEEESSSEEEPDVWRCECCRKDFKSEGQMENHMKSKKHKEKYKKYQAKLAKQPKKQDNDDIMDEMLNDMTL